MAVARWKTCFSGESMPACAVVAGYDTDCDPIYVGQAYHEDHLLPAKVIREEQSSYACVSYDGEVFRKDSFNVLCDVGMWSARAMWDQCLEQTIPCCAIPGGRTAAGVELYVGRFAFLEEPMLGKVFPNEWKAYGFYNNCEVVDTHFELLTCNR